jgi:GxxExxY protein
VENKTFDRDDERATRDPQTYAIIGAAIEVHRTLGSGFLEAVYHEALAIELAARSVPFKTQVQLALIYKGRVLACHYRADFVCYERVIVEIKALNQISGTEEAQLLNYLKATKLPIGLLINFGATSLQYRRRILTTQSAESAKSVDNPS